MSRVLLAVAATLLGGCFGLLNNPDFRRRDGAIETPDAGPPDAGPEDAGPEDAGPPDGGPPDGGPPDAGPLDGGCPGGQRYEATCDDESDNDCDGASDCDDFDCGRALICCGMGVDVLNETFGATTYNSALWASLPAGLMPTVAPSGGSLSVLGESATGPRALRLRACLPIDLGVRMNGTATIRTMCAGDPAACDEYVQFVLTPAVDAVLGSALLDELAVRIRRNGIVELRRAGRVLSMGRMSAGLAPMTVSIELSPGLDESGRAWVFGTVSVTQTGSPTWTPRVAMPLIPRDDLLDADAGCTSVRGLFLALEGVGRNIAVDDVTVDRFECANPGHFERVTPAGSIEGASDVGATSAWTTGGLGAPALSSHFQGAAMSDTDRWTLLFDGADRERTAELFAPIGLSIGQAQRSGDWTTDDWSAWPMEFGGNPVLGCTSGVPAMCDNPPSHREPYLSIPVDEDTRVVPTAASDGRTVFARAHETLPSRFGLWATTEVLDTGLVRIGEAFQLLALEDETSTSVQVAPCASMREPVLLPARDGEPGSLLLFVCEHDGEASDVRAATLSPTTWSAVGVTLLDEPVLTAAQLGPSATGGIRALDGAVWFRDDGTATYRVWLVTRDQRRRSVLAFAEGTGPVGALPALIPYAANPVLAEDDPLLGPCGTACEIDSVAVARAANTPNVVRLLIARTVEDATGIRHPVVPLDQTWPQ